MYKIIFVVISMFLVACSDGYFVSVPNSETGIDVEEASSSFADSDSESSDVDIHVVDAVSDVCVPKTCDSISSYYRQITKVYTYSVSEPFGSVVFDVPEDGQTNICPNNDPSCSQQYDDGCGNNITCENWCYNLGIVTTGPYVGRTIFGGSYCFGTPKFSWATCFRMPAGVSDWLCK